MTGAKTATLKGGNRSPDRLALRAAPPLTVTADPERRAMGLAVEWLMHGESAVWCAASDEDRAAAMGLVERGRE